MRRGLCVAAVACVALIAVCLPASAPAQAPAPQPSFAKGVAKDAAKELLVIGAKAALAEFAPGLLDTVDPTGAALADIKATLVALDAKISSLQSRNEDLASRQLCATHVASLRAIVSDARTKLGELNAAASLPDATARASRIDKLETNLNALNTEQDQLHTTLVDGAISACGLNLQNRMKPFFTSQLAPEVRDWYATYRDTALALLTVRLNLMAYPAPVFGTSKTVTVTTASGAVETQQVPVRVVHFTVEQRQQAIDKVKTFLAREEAQIKPAFPNTESVYLPAQLVFKTQVPFDGLQNGATNNLFKAGWGATVRDSIGCDTLVGIFDALGVGRGRVVRTTLASRGILNVTSPYVYCDRQTTYDLDNSKYESAAHVITYVSKKIGTVLTHPLAGYLDLSQWEYK